MGNLWGNGILVVAVGDGLYRLESVNRTVQRERFVGVSVYDPVVWRCRIGGFPEVGNDWDRYSCGRNNSAYFALRDESIGRETEEIEQSAPAEIQNAVGVESANATRSRSYVY